jgi:hypothetical protein
MTLRVYWPAPSLIAAVGNLARAAMSGETTAKRIEEANEHMGYNPPAHRCS